MAIHGPVRSVRFQSAASATLGAHDLASRQRVKTELEIRSGLKVETTTASGTFILSGVPDGRYRVSAWSQAFSPARSAAFEASGDVPGLLLLLSRGATLKGNVLGLELDELGSLSLTAFSSGSRRLGTVDVSSRYTFTNLEPGVWMIDALATSSGRSARVRVDVPEGMPAVEQDLEFDPSVTRRR